ncbi:MAG: thiamine phosphate synthase [Phycisphaerae bacterium]|nr:thiamine phosphate synthase [Phycisphaerae bacterium]
MEKAVYRIIDANFNRGREAARVMEEYCRFFLDSGPLTARAKRLRHQLCGAVARLDAGKLMTARDSAGDVGRGMQVGDQMVRRQLGDALIAACKRLTEALRALAETTAIVDAEVAGAFEALRFEAYALEKDITLSGDARQRFGGVRLYVLITASPEDSDSRVLELAAECSLGGADCIQLRAKNIPDDRVFHLSGGLVRICAEHNVLSIINDRVDIAVATGADGVHLGQNDLPLAEARRLQTRPMLFGLSTHSTEQLDAAIAENPAYIALGPAFATATKAHEPCVGPAYIRPALGLLGEAGIAHVAIGGITLDNLEEVLGWGVRAIAVCSAVTHARNTRTQCRQFKERLRGR